VQLLEVSGAVRPLYGSLGVKGITNPSYLTVYLWNVRIDFCNFPEQVRFVALRSNVCQICALVGFTQGRIGCYYRRLENAFWTARPLKMGHIECPETPVIHYHFTLYKCPNWHRSQSKAAEERDIRQYAARGE